MSSAENLAIIETEGRRIIDCARHDPEVPVPQYPTWTLRDLTIHVASVHGRTTAICTTLPHDRIAAASLPPSQDPFDWAGKMLTQMVQALRAADPETPVWTFVPDPRLAFWERRMVIETGVHRWDAQAALGLPDSLLPIVASHGLDEFPELYLPRLGDVPPIELVATDLGRAWRYGTGDPAATVSGTASNLFLRLMSRPGTPLPASWETAVDTLASPVG